MLAGSAAYAIGEGRKWPVGLARKPREAAAFYGVLEPATGRFTYVNTAFCSLVDKPRDLVLGKTDFDLYPQALAEKYRR